MWLRSFKTCSLQNNLQKHFNSNVLLSEKPISCYKSYSTKSRKNNDAFFQRGTKTIGSSIGFAVLLGILDSKKKSELGIYTSLQTIRNRIRLSAATITSTNFKNGASPRETFNFLADVVAKTQNSVVYIEITAKHPLSRKRFPVSSGSGFIVKEDGLILTNAHVVNHYGHVVVKLYDGREFDAVVENVDSDTDLATVRIQAKNLPELSLGQSSDLRPGEFVIAMGNPLTLSHTITAGVVSANRPSKELGLHQKTDYIQTDAAINVGNSGGPLVNLDGEAIGINTMKVTEGISFAIPSNRAIEFLKKAEQKSSWNLFKRAEERSKHNFLGIGMMTLSPVVIKNIKERNPDFPSIDHGVLVWKVMILSPSYECGIRPGDVISQINGNEVYSAEDIQACLEKNHILKMTIKRGQKTFQITVETVEMVMP